MKTTNKNIKSYSLEEANDILIGKKGTTDRDAFDQELKLERIRETIKQARQKRHLTQEQLGKMIGVQKAQISKIENSLTDVRLGTLMKVFEALNVKVDFKVKFV